MTTPDDERLFTLTAEEISLVETGLEYYKEQCDGMLKAYKGLNYLTDHAIEVFEDGIIRLDNILTRLKQWQDEIQKQAD